MRPLVVIIVALPAEATVVVGSAGVAGSVG